MKEERKSRRSFTGLTELYAGARSEMNRLVGRHPRGRARQEPPPPAGK